VSRKTMENIVLVIIALCVAAAAYGSVMVWIE